MAALTARFLFHNVRRNISYTAVRCTDKIMAEPFEHATGLEKRELLLRQAGNDDPFDMRVFKRGPGTQASPNLVPSAFEERLVGCVCQQDATCVNYMWLKKGEPRRCECGHWFKLIEKAPV